MLFDILTLFPEMFSGVLDYSIIARARDRNLVDIRLHNVRDYTSDIHHTADDYPYGGGAGMVLKPEPIHKAINDVLQGNSSASVIVLTPRGRLLNQAMVKEIGQQAQIVLICGHYEGIDERVAERMVTDQISIGDYVLSGGEIAAMVILDSLVRLIPGALGSVTSIFASTAR